MIVLETDRLIIRESSRRDFSRIYSMMLSETRENESAPFCGDKPGARPVGAIRDAVSEDEDEELEKYLAYIHTVYSVFGFGLWTVCLKEDPSCIIGRCGLQPIADDNSPLGRIELGYLIDERWRGQGYASEAACPLIRHLFENLPLTMTLKIDFEVSNQGSRKIAQKICDDIMKYHPTYKY